MENNRARVVGKSAVGLASTLIAIPPPAPAGPRPAPQRRSLSADLQHLAPQPVPSSGRHPSAPPLIPEPPTVLAKAKTTDLVPPSPLKSAILAPSMLPSAEALPAPQAPSVAQDPPPPARQPTVYLAALDDLEKAPSIGPKTAERFAAFGVRTVADFLAADPAAMASKIEARHITAAVVADWQAQSRLVMGIPGLRGTHAQLLVGAGLRTVADIAAAPAGKLAADILAFAATTDGQRVLRDGAPPNIDRIKSWCDAARQVLAA